MQLARIARPRIAAVALSAAIVLVSTAAYATPSIGAHDVPTIFYVAKSDDRNRVDYGVHLDASCSPVGAEPLYAYWRRFEPGQPLLGDLNMFDATAYGIARQQVSVRSATGSWIELGLAALPSRRLLVLVQPVGDHCVAAVQTTIRGQEAVLDHVFVQLDGPMRVREVVLRGEVRMTGQPITERLTP